VTGWGDLRGRRVGVWGLGREGAANVRKLAELGVTPVRVDDNPGSPEIIPTKDGGLEALAHCEVVVKTPGISRYRPEVAELVRHGVTMAGGLGLWLAEQDLTRIVCVTGTKGKSTTTSILAHLLTRLGHPCAAGGNIGTAPWDPDREPPGNEEYWAIEVSSYQATDLHCAPPVVAVTSLHPDHLDWHGDVDRYFRDKLSLCTQPGARLTVANGDSQLLREFRSQLGPHVDWVHADDDPEADWMAPLGLLGQHNRRNALIARHCIRALGIDAGDAELNAAAAGYQGLPSRLATVGSVDGVLFVDDSLSTNVLPTLAALDAFPGQRVALIVGGHDRGIDYAPLAEGLARRAAQAPLLVLTVPDNGPRIHDAITAAAGSPETVDCADLAAATEAGFRWAQPGGVVLLSPAAPSFGRFRDYRDRGEAFARAATSLRPLSRDARRAAGRARRAAPWRRWHRAARRSRR
jgi:UDP-N-acetylmuramoylalanine--D-glutamate ligase